MKVLFKTAGAAAATAVIAQIILSVFQLMAIVSGVGVILGIHWIFAFILWLFVTPIPFLPTVLGFIGAMRGWGWEWWQAGLLFFGLQIVVLTLTASVGATLLSVFKKRKALDQ